MFDVEKHPRSLPASSYPESLSSSKPVDNLPARKDWQKSSIGEVIACAVFAVILGLGVWLAIFYFAPRLGLYLGWLPCLQVGFWAYVYPLEMIQFLIEILCNILSDLHI